MSNTKVLSEKPGEFTIEPLTQAELFSFDPKGAHPQHITEFEKSLSQLQKSVSAINMGFENMFSIQTIWHHLPNFKRQEIGSLANENFQGNYNVNYFQLTYGQKLHVLSSMYALLFTPELTEQDV